MPILMHFPAGTNLLTNRPVADDVSDLLRDTANLKLRFSN
jgi:hypothetical protein